jgi:tetratricopeptide (TPR) repeat protein
LRGWILVLLSLSSLLVPATALADHSMGSSATTPSSSAPVRMIEGLSTLHHPVTTTNQEAQQYFDQGLRLVFAFNHDEAIRSFQEAARIDRRCAMAWWGIALCNGPHINNPTMDAEHSKTAYEALTKAQSLADRASPVEKRLIQALSRRYASTPPADRGPLDQAYADDMRSVWKVFPRDPDVGALFAESLMDLHPWDLWTLDKQPKVDTPEIVETLEKVLSMKPDHPGGNHLYVHAVEASSRPDRGTAAADRLRALVPGAGHLVHMPAHIYVRTGRWADAATANERAIEVDRAYRARSAEPGFYRIYMLHNHQFLAWGSMMEGRSELAVREARAMMAEMPAEALEALASFVDGTVALPYATLARFGRWDEILKEPEPAAFLPVTRALWHFARGTALASSARTEEAEKELAALREIAAGVKDDATVGNSKAKDVLAIAAHVLTGEIAAQRNRNDEAVAELREAVKLEDGNRYDEPPDWLQPVRHTLGAVLLRAGRAAEAEVVYREDLARWPENGWSLWGLARALEKEGKRDDALAVQARFHKAWARADVKLDTTCLCLPGL